MQEANNSVQRFHHWLQNDIDNKFSMYYFEQKSVGNDVSMLRNLLQMHSHFTLVMRLKKQRILIKKLQTLEKTFGKN